MLSYKRPKAIFLIGPSGSGKSTFLQNYLSKPNYKIINSDIIYEGLLKSNNIPLQQIYYTPEQLSSAAKLQSQAVKLNNTMFSQYSQSKQDLIIDSTGASSKPLIEKYNILKANNYNILFLIVLTDPITSLHRNNLRPRKLNPNIILRNWRDVTKNIPEYKKIFPINSYIINNSPGVYQEINQYNLQPYLLNVPLGKTKTIKEQEKSSKEKMQVLEDINTNIKYINSIGESYFTKFDSLKIVLDIFNN